MCIRLNVSFRFSEIPFGAREIFDFNWKSFLFCLWERLGRTEWINVFYIFSGIHVECRFLFVCGEHFAMDSIPPNEADLNIEHMKPTRIPIHKHEGKWEMWKFITHWITIILYNRFSLKYIKHTKNTYIVVSLPFPHTFSVPFSFHFWILNLEAFRIFDFPVFP